MAENKTTYEKKIIVAIKVTSEQELEWFTLEALRSALQATVSNPYTVPHESVRMSVEEHSCPKLAPGPVDQAFKRIDQLEERMCECLGHFVDALRSAKHGR